MWIENPYRQVFTGEVYLQRGVTRAKRAMIKRRSAIEPTIEHMKKDGKLGRNWVNGP
jgi:hypothetical protein